MKQYSAIDISVIEELRAIQPDGEEDLVQNLGNMFFENAVKQIQKIKDAVAKDDFETVASEAHSLKSSAGYLGATPLRKICLQIEHVLQTNQKNILATLATDLEKEYVKAEQELKDILESSKKAA